jgi:hypothetical protein
MSAVVVWGNIFDTAVITETYVVYRMSDPTLNSESFPEFYAARYVEPDVVAPNPGLRFIGQPSYGTTTTNLLPSREEELVATPEPAYSLLFLLLIVYVLWKGRFYTMAGG